MNSSTTMQVKINHPHAIRQSAAGSRAAHRGARESPVLSPRELRRVILDLLG